METVFVLTPEAAAFCFSRTPDRMRALALEGRLPHLWIHGMGKPRRGYAIEGLVKCFGEPKPGRMGVLEIVEAGNTQAADDISVLIGFIPPVVSADKETETKE